MIMFTGRHLTISQPPRIVPARMAGGNMGAFKKWVGLLSVVGWTMACSGFAVDQENRQKDFVGMPGTLAGVSLGDPASAVEAEREGFTRSASESEGQLLVEFQSGSVGSETGTLYWEGESFSYSLVDGRVAMMGYAAYEPRELSPTLTDLFNGVIEQAFQRGASPRESAGSERTMRRYHWFEGDIDLKANLSSHGGQTTLDLWVSGKAP